MEQRCWTFLSIEPLLMTSIKFIRCILSILEFLRRLLLQPRIQSYEYFINIKETIRRVIRHNIINQMTDSRTPISVCLLSNQTVKDI